MLSLAVAFVFVLLLFFSPFIIVITSLGEERESWSMCFLCICLFLLRQMLTFLLFLVLLVSEVTAAFYLFIYLRNRSALAVNC